MITSATPIPARLLPQQQVSQVRCRRRTLMGCCGRRSSSSPLWMPRSAVATVRHLRADPVLAAQMLNEEVGDAR